MLADLKEPAKLCLRILGRMCDAKIGLSIYHGDWLRLIDADGNTMGCICPDYKPELEAGQCMYCLEVRGESTWSAVRIPIDLHGPTWDYEDDKFGALCMGMALVPDETYVGAYKRVGLVRWMKRSYLKDVLPKEVVIY